MKIEVDTVKGFQDILPPESTKRESVKKVIEKWFGLYGFFPIETPIVEYDELMKSESSMQEDEAVSDRFRLKDRANRNLGLRYEFTFQLSRIFKQNPNIKLPFRRYQIGPVFRDEPIGTNRFRQFTQCDADIVGDESTSADADCLFIVSEILKELNISNIEIQINNRKLLNSIIDSVQITQKEQVMKELDKIDKIGEDQVKVNLKKYADSNQIITLLRLLNKSIEFFKENAFEGVNELEQLQEKCSKYGIKVAVNPFMVRGLSYYTGNIFEIKQEGGESIAAGGRYDKSVGKYINREIPAVGISFGLERVSSLANLPIKSQLKAVIISFNQEKASIKLAKALRKEDISCMIMEGKPAKALDFANSYQVPYAIFIGDEEIQKNKFKLKELSSGNEKLLQEKQIIKSLK